MAESKRIIFMGTPDFAVQSLTKLFDRYDIVGVVTQPPQRLGRGMNEWRLPVYIEAERLNLPIYTPTKFDDITIKQLTVLKPDFLVVVAYGLILPQAVLDIPKVMAINGHASLLPRWRGAAPIHRAIAAQDQKTGVTTMKMEAGLDTGPILLSNSTEIKADDTMGSLHDRLARMTAELLIGTIENIDAIDPTPQDHCQATYASKVTSDEAEINFNQPTDVIDAHVRAFDPIPGAWIALGTDDDGKIIRLHVKKIQIVSTEQSTAGTVIGIGDQGGPVIATFDGAIELIKIQPQGKHSMSGKDFLNGNKLPDKIQRASQLMSEYN